MKRWLAMALVVTACGDKPETQTPVVGRISHMEVPESPDHAQRAGCLVDGELRGAALGSLSVLSGGLSRHFVADDRPARIVRLVERGATEIRILDGIQTSATSYAVADDPRPSTFVIVTEHDDWFAATGPTFRMPIPVLDDLLMTAELKTVRLERHGHETSRIDGYLRSSELERLLGDVFRRCQADEPPAVCEIVSSQIPFEAPTAVQFIEYTSSFIGAPDAALDASNHPASCTRFEDCNAYRVCLAITVVPL